MKETRWESVESDDQWIKPSETRVCNDFHVRCLKSMDESTYPTFLQTEYGWVDNLPKEKK